MSEREEIVIFDDGSIASRLLQHELKDKYDIKVVGVNIADDLFECFAKISSDKKVHLHYTYEKYAENKEQLRKDIQNIEHLGFRNLVVLDYEGLDQKTMEYRAADAGIVGRDKEGRPDIKVTGKPVAIILDEPTKEFTVKDNTVVVKDEEFKDKPYRTVRTRKKV